MRRVAVANRARYLLRREHPLVRVLTLVAVLVVWEGFARLGWVPVLFLPSPLGVLREGWEMTVSGELALHIVSSLKRLVLGFALGTGLGIAVGVAVGFFALAEAVGTPLIAATFRSRRSRCCRS